ncbi:radical SAM protein [Candidatus Woesearchaeota archaeon]|jgi:organic radical activating enzyme|nr:radical SAM protein [Candidatus Woesearchaeota archaeon]
MSLNQIFISKECNRGCNYCLAKHVLKNNQHINFNEFKFYFDNFIANKFNRINLLGGEPTNHPELKQIIDYILNFKEDFEILITTNGLFHQRLFEKYSNMKNFKFNFHCAHNEKEFNIIFNNIKLLKEKNAEIALTAVIHDQTDEQEIIKHIQNIKPNIVMPVISLPTQKKNNEYISEINDKNKYKIKVIIEECIKQQIQIKQHCFSPICMFTIAQKNKLLKNNFIFEKCNNGLFVFPNLDVHICPFLDQKIGNLKKNSLNDIQEIRNNIIKKLDHIMMKKCTSCTLKKRGSCKPCAAHIHNQLPS